MGKKEAIPMYLCKRCHREFSPLQSFPLPPHAIDEHLIRNSYGNLPELQLHRCDTMNRGIAELVGFELKEIEDTESLQVDR